MPGPILVVGELLADLVAVTPSPPGRVVESASAGRVVESGRAPLVVESGRAPLALEARPGGSPANVAVGLARLAAPVEFAGRLSDRGIGPWLVEHLRANGVGLSHAVAAGELPTIAFVGLDPAGVATYGFYGADTADWQWRPGELPDLDGSPITAVHAGSLATVLGPGAAVMAAWGARVGAGGRVLVSYDPNIRPTLVDDLVVTVDRVESWVRTAHLVKVSAEDLGVLYPDQPVLAAARCWAAAGPELVVVTDGGAGATALRAGRQDVARQGPAVAVVDTVGAGDAFQAGLLAGLASAGALRPGGPAGLSDRQLIAVLDQANLVAAITCTRAGADPPTVADLERLGPELAQQVADD